MVAAALVGAGGAAAQAASGLRHNDPHALKLENEFATLYNSATRYVDGRYQECRVSPPVPAPTELAHGSPDPALLATLAILRRPAQPGDSLPPMFASGLDSFRQRIYVDYVRTAYAADGTKFTIFPFRPRSFPPTPRSCVARRHQQLVRLLKGKPNDLRRFTLTEDARLSREERIRGSIRRTDGLFSFSGDGGSGGENATSLRRFGSFMTGGSGNGASSRVDGVIPDRVVSINFVYDRVVSQGTYRNPKTYRTRVIRNERVQNNVVDFTVPRPPQDAFPSRMVWHLSNGRSRVVTPPVG